MTDASALTASPPPWSRMTASQQARAYAGRPSASA
jgi:hypothetical protein